jgi:hypothetical protein
VPDSDFTKDAEFGSPKYWIPIAQRVNLVEPGQQNPQDGAIHGTGLVSTVALPSRQALVPGVETTITANTGLKFAVTVKNTGDAQEVQVKVTLTIEQEPQNIVATQTIDVINSGEEKTVTFERLPQVQFAVKVRLKVDVAPVPNELRIENNSAEYPVIFSLG